MSSSPLPTEEASVTSRTETEAQLSRPFVGRRRMLRRLLFLSLGFYLGACVMLGLLQRHLIYFPTRVEHMLPIDWGIPADRCVSLEVLRPDETVLHGWHVLPPALQDAEEDATAAPADISGQEPRSWQQQQLDRGRPVILFCPGNAGHRGYRAEELDLLSQLQADVFLFDYRGYGENSGSPSEAAILPDMEAIWTHLTDELDIAPERILILGESLGGGVACGLAAHLAERNIEPGGLFLKTSFASLVELAQQNFPVIPVNWLMTERYPSAKRIAQVTCPIGVLHGQEDEIIPFAQAEKLFAAAPEKSRSGIPKQFFALPHAHHNDVLFTAAKDYLQAVNGMLQHIRTANL